MVRETSDARVHLPRGPLLIAPYVGYWNHDYKVRV